MLSALLRKAAAMLTIVFLRLSSPHRLFRVTRYETRLSISAWEAVVAGIALPATGERICFFNSLAVLRLPIPSSGKLVFPAPAIE